MAGGADRSGVGGPAAAGVSVIMAAWSTAAELQALKLKPPAPPPVSVPGSLVG